jgi:hypothetical protein
LTRHSRTSTTSAVGPPEYWNSTQTRRAQRLYVSFCELAAAALDYAEGLSLLRRDVRRQGAARLNWAGTAFYYSLVHSARFLIFTAAGDFPTKHNELADAFSKSRSGTVSTDWLKRFAPSPTVRYTTKVNFEEVVDFWARGTSREQVVALFEWFADTLSKARALRNENNYEALLIAHEYKHSYLDGSFKQLANAMEGVAKAGLTAIVAYYARVLQPESISGADDTCATESDAALSPEGGGTSDDWLSRNIEAAFIRRYVETRIIEPAENWYGTEVHFVSKTVTELMEPLRTLDIRGDLDLTAIEEAVSVDLFEPKTGLMNKFTHKITELRETLHQIPTTHTTDSAEIGVPTRLQIRSIL